MVSIHQIKETNTKSILSITLVLSLLIFRGCMNSTGNGKQVEGGLTNQFNKLYDPSKPYYEIVQWFNYDYQHQVVSEDSTCYTIALFKNNIEVPDLQFVGNRPFKLDEYKTPNFWSLAQYGQSLLEAEYTFNELRG